MPAGGITLPDALDTLDIDLFNNLEASLSLTQPFEADSSQKADFAMDWTPSQMLPTSSTRARDMEEERPHFEDDTGIELDLGDPYGEDTGVEIGRDAPPQRPVGEDIMSEDNKLFEDEDLGLDLGDEPLQTEAAQAPIEDPEITFGGDDDMGLGGDLDVSAPGDDEGVPALTPDRAERDSQSPLSSVRSSVVRDLETEMFEPPEEEMFAQQAHKAKRRKVLQADSDTVLHSHQIKEQQADRSKILKPVSFLPKDPFLLTLMQMQKSGDFITDVMGEGRTRGWAPELRDILSIESIRQSGELKRKRDGVVASIEGADVQAGLERDPTLDLGDPEADLPVDVTLGGDVTATEPSGLLDLPADEGVRPPMSDEPPYDQREESVGEGITAGFDTFDETTAPLVHPADSGPVSLGTKHAVHLLRDRFGASAAESQTQPRNASVLFQEMLPEGRTSKADATKMFFEVLVLATKDAVKVDQGSDGLGLPIRIRGKRGLWGSWAETEAGGEIASQATQPQAVGA